MDFEKYFEHLSQKYADWLVNWHPENPEYIAKRKAEFKSSLSVEGGEYYKITYKIVSIVNVHSFICKADNGKFKRGDILKAKNDKCPAKILPKGNILNEDFKNIEWDCA